MNLIAKKIKWLAVILILFGIVACSDDDGAPFSESKETKATQVVTLDVYKSETCGCCEDWIKHVGASGFHSVVHHPDDLGSVKANVGISPRYRSCHTAISNHGYVFEGHVPADIMQQFLANPPEDALGLAVPGMPVGSPGMEMGDRFDPYDVLLLKNDGTSELYVRMLKPGG